jgi:hypothetical protein
LIDEINDWVLKDVPACLCSIEGSLELLSAKEAHQRYIDLVENVLTPYLPASALVELGAGYGNIILALGKRQPLAEMRIIAGEYTASGVELIERLARAEGVKIEVGHCDFALPTIADFFIPENAVIFTSYATPCVPKLPTEFVTALSAYRPQAVVNIEPCYEYCDTKSLLGLMRRRYIEVNDYNTNLLTLLYDRRQEGLIRILEERPCVFGSNPLLAASVIVWAPEKQTLTSQP